MLQGICALMKEHGELRKRQVKGLIKAPKTGPAGMFKGIHQKGNENNFLKWTDVKEKFGTIC